jgi:hypothetical protein
MVARKVEQMAALLVVGMGWMMAVMSVEWKAVMLVCASVGQLGAMLVDMMVSKTVLKLVVYLVWRLAEMLVDDLDDL